MTVAQSVPETKSPNIRNRIFWEIGSFICANPAVPADGNRHMSINVGNGSGEHFEPSLRLATGTANLAYEVVAGGIDMSFMNPSAMLTQAYRGVGLFSRKLPVRVIASYPSSDRYIIAIRESLGLRTLSDVLAAKPKLRISIRHDPAHSGHIVLGQLLGHYGLSLGDFEAWGCTVQRVTTPHAESRLEAMRDGTVDMVFDEGVHVWLNEALGAGMIPLELDDEAFAHLAALGWRRKPVSPDRFPLLKRDYDCIDFSGWPLYASAALPDHIAYDVCRAINARQAAIPWEDTYTGMDSLFQDADATPIDVPLHPGAARWYEEHRT